MLTVVLTGAIIAGFAATAMLSCRSDQEAGQDGEHDGGAAGETASASHTIAIDPTYFERIGLRTETLVASEIAPALRAFGRVLDPAPLAEVEAAFVTARAARDVAQRELTRSRALFERDGSVSGRALESIEADATRARVEADVAHARLVGAIGATLAERGDLETFVRELVAGDARLVRLDPAPGDALGAVPHAAHIEPAIGAAAPVHADYVGEAGTIDTVTQGRSYFFVVDSPPPALAPGTAVIGYIGAPGDAVSGVVVPSTAIVRAEGRAWVYVESTPGTYERRLVELDRPTVEGVLVGGGVAAGDSVVVVGAQELLSTELAARLGSEED